MAAQQLANTKTSAEVAGENRPRAWWANPVVLGSVTSAAIGLMVSPRSANTTVSARLFGHNLVVAHGGASTFALMVMFFVGFWVPGWAIVNAIRTPKSTFASLGRSKARWVASMVILFVIGDASLVLVPIYYLLRVRPQLISDQEAKQR
ncbi:MAG: hypothetical protein HKL87_03100 [Acidimicrobiaceae bacterium]|nr:hypothetical protein [Acidimicrobiaceae bacterium]